MLMSNMVSGEICRITETCDKNCGRLVIIYNNKIQSTVQGSIITYNGYLVSTIDDPDNVVEYKPFCGDDEDVEVEHFCFLSDLVKETEDDFPTADELLTKMTTYSKEKIAKKIRETADAFITGTTIADKIDMMWIEKNKQYLEDRGFIVEKCNSFITISWK